MSQAPRIVNIINFIREVEPRFKEGTPDALYQTVVNQIDLLKKYELPATFPLQYDAMIVEHYQKLLKERLDEHDEVGCWFEPVQPLVEKAGLTWRGRWPWDPDVRPGFSVGYTPAEREKLVDIFITDFRKLFGRTPSSFSSWFMDAHTLAYVVDKYGITASANCKDQWGTDSYTIWGGYWNQAYYPSRFNSLCPAQTEKNQIPVPVFRMLGSDPIYQYDCSLGSQHQDVVSLEPVYGSSGSSQDWVRWFFDSMMNQPCLAFGYAQAGQENSFTWETMRKGYEAQIPYIAQLAREGRIRVETLERSAKWFRSRYKLTPPTAVTALTDHRNENRKTAWYNCRFYRVNFLWHGEQFRVRDIHLFDETYRERYLTEVVTTQGSTYDTLPALDGYNWSTADAFAGIRIVDKNGTPFAGGEPRVTEPNETELQVTWPLEGSGALDIRCAEKALTFAVTGRTAPWALQMSWSPEKTPPIRSVSDKAIAYEHNGFSYALCCARGRLKQAESGGPILFAPEDGQVVFDMALRERG